MGSRASTTTSTRQARAYAVGLRHGSTALIHAWRTYGPNSPLVGLLGALVATVSSSPFALLAVHVAIYATLLTGILLLRELGLAPPARPRRRRRDRAASGGHGLRRDDQLHARGDLRTGLGLRGLPAQHQARRRPSVALGVLLGVRSLTRVLARWST